MTISSDSDADAEPASDLRRDRSARENVFLKGFGEIFNTFRNLSPSRVKVHLSPNFDLKPRKKNQLRTNRKKKSSDLISLKTKHDVFDAASDYDTKTISRTPSDGNTGLALIEQHL